MLPIEWWTLFSGPHIIVLEEGVGGMKEHFIQELVLIGATQQRRIRILTPSAIEEVEIGSIQAGIDSESNSISVVRELKDRRSLFDFCTSEFNVIERFIWYCMDDSAKSILETMEELRNRARNGHTILLSIDLGILPASHERILEAIADGVIQFLTRIEEERVRHFLYIPKMIAAPLTGKLVPLDITEEGLQVDTRERYG